MEEKTRTIEKVCAYDKDRKKTYLIHLTLTEIRGRLSLSMDLGFGLGIGLGRVLGVTIDSSLSAIFKAIDQEEELQKYRMLELNKGLIRKEIIDHVLTEV